MTKQELLDAVPAFVEAHWPKRDPEGQHPTPGRGEATVAIARFILEVVPDDGSMERQEKRLRKHAEPPVPFGQTS